MRKPLLILIISAAVLLRVAVALYFGNAISYYPAIADQLSYHTLASRVLDGFGFTFNLDWWPATNAGEPTAHWSYLYTIYLTIVYSLFGKNPLAARLIQAVAGGVLMPWLAYKVTKGVFPRKGYIEDEQAPPRFTQLNWLYQFWLNKQETISLLAAAWVAFYGYYIYFGAALMTETFYIIGILWTINCSLRIANRQSISSTNEDETNRRRRLYSLISWIELGFAISITTILRQVFLPFVPFLFLWLWWAGYRREIPRSSKSGIAIRRASINLLQGGLITILIMLLFIAPITYFNYQQFGRIVLLNTNAGFAFYYANHPIYGVKYVPILTPDMPNYKDLIPKELLKLNEAALDNELMRRGMGFVIADPIRYIRLTLDRIPSYFLFWPLSTSSLISNINRVLSYGIALPFILAGIVLWGLDVRRKRVRVEPGSLLLLFALVYSAIHLLSWVGVRYRLPVDVVCLVFAARSLYQLGRHILIV